MERVQGKVAIVTGGAKGIGRSAALLLAREGAKVVVTDIDQPGGEAAAAEIKAVGGEATFMAHDVTDEQAWETVVAATKSRFGGLGVVNNAGIGVEGNAEDTTLDEWRRTMAVNLDAVFLGTKHGIRAMKDGVGPIINLSSIEGLVGDPNLAAYNARKGGVRLFTKSAALYCARACYKVRVSSVHPGFIWTQVVEDYLTRLGDVEDGRKAIEAAHPVGHPGGAGRRRRGHPLSRLRRVEVHDGERAGYRRRLHRPVNMDRRRTSPALQHRDEVVGQVGHRYRPRGVGNGEVGVATPFVRNCTLAAFQMPLNIQLGFEKGV